jgi:hypothetical protein
MIRRLAVLLTAAAIVLAAAAPAGAKSVSHIGASCSAGTAGYGIALSSGARTTVGFGAGGAGSTGTWTVTAVDSYDGGYILNWTGFMGTPAWTVSTTRSLPKGFHSIAITASNLTTGEVCTTGFSTKV